MMDRTALLKELQQALPVPVGTASLGPGNVGLVVVDVVRGFTREGALSDPASMAPMVQAVGALATQLDQQLGQRLHTLLLRDSHHPDIPEPPYPPHCIQGTGEDELDPDIDWLAQRPRTTVIRKDCINGFVGAMRPATRPVDGQPSQWRNLLADWVADNGLTSLVLSGDCTDICVSDLCVALLSARNHGMLTRVDPGQREQYVEAITGLQLYVHAPACATFDADPEASMPEGMEALRHPGPLAHHLGLWIAASRGAIIVDSFEV